MKLFMWFYRLHKTCIEREKTAENLKKRAAWALLEGFSKAGIYYFS